VKVVFGARARRELMAQIDWLVDRAPTSAVRAADHLAAALDLLRDFPLAAPVLDEHHRDITVPFGRDGFVLRYRVEGEVVTIVRVFHGRQRR
jgi:plasmid stabilization system protein ParE